MDNARFVFRRCNDTPAYTCNHNTFFDLVIIFLSLHARRQKKFHLSFNATEKISHICVERAINSFISYFRSHKFSVLFNFECQIVKIILIFIFHERICANKYNDHGLPFFHKRFKLFVCILSLL